MSIPEPNKLPGVCYASTADGLELPIIDVSLPLFRSDVSDAVLFERAQAYLKSLAAPGFLKGLFYRFVVPHFMKRSVMGRGLMKAWGGYLDAITTYLLKLPPEALGAWATKTDRKIAEGLRLSAQTVSLRLQDIAELLAQALAPHLQAAPGAPLHFVNIAGGPSIDSLNVLMLLRRKDPSLLEGRPIRIQTLDLEEDGAVFGRNALASLKAEGAPLHGLDLGMALLSYDWNRSAVLEDCLKAIPRDAVLAASSEGGLFDYGSDDAVRANLKALHALAPARSVLGASLSRPDGVAAVPTSRMAALALRTVEDFERIAAPEGWTVSQKRGRPMSWVLTAERKA